MTAYAPPLKVASPMGYHLTTPPNGAELSGAGNLASIILAHH